MNLVSVVTTLVVMIVTGAVIGGLTNFIAIKMLFRPHRAIYMGRWRLPFTPGLIPKRQEEIAGQLGRLVMTHLLTEENLKQKMTDSSVIESLTKVIGKKFDRWVSSEKTIRHYLEKIGDSQEGKEVAVQGLSSTLERFLDKKIKGASVQPIQNWLPNQVDDLVLERIPATAAGLSEILVQFAESPDGKEKIAGQIEQFFSNRGMVGNMLTMFLGNQSIVDKFYPAFIDFLQQPGFTSTLEDLMRTSWSRLKQQPINRWIDEATLMNLGETLIHDWLLSREESSSWLDEPPRKWLNASVVKAVNKHLPQWIEKLVRGGSERIPDFLDWLNLEDVVREQVKQFSLYELEEVVLMVSKKEFKMITYLGAFLGGVIGFIQALMVFILT